MIWNYLIQFETIRYFLLLFATFWKVSILKNEDNKKFYTKSSKDLKKRDTKTIHKLAVKNGAKKATY